MFLTGTEEAPLPLPIRIAYQRNTMADDAFLHFSAVLDHPRVFYVHSFAAVCEEVLYGRCAFAILPMESTGEGRLSTVSRLIDRYGLHVLMTTEIKSPDGLRNTVFALLGRDLRLLDTPQPASHVLELSVQATEEPPIEELLFAARLCGLRLEQMDTVTDPTDESRTVLHPRFSASDDAFCTFLCYRAMEAPNSEIVGFYFSI